LRELLEAHDPASPAIIEPKYSKNICYGNLIASIHSIEDRLKRLMDRAPIFLYSSNTPDAIAIYLACLSLGYPICILEPAPANLDRLVEIYKPPMVVLPSGVPLAANYVDAGELPATSYRAFLAEGNVAAAPHPELALLVQTSGSTGDPKLVRLSLNAILANARSIVQYLDLTPNERSIQGLPVHYSYGLSLINSHLISGGAVVLTEHSFMRPEFWRDFDTAKCTSFAGVPYMYEILQRLRFSAAKHPSLRTMTQAGGALRADLTEAFYKDALAAKCRLFVMYGQTEAAPRISYVPPERLGEKIGSIGIPIPGGHLELVETEDLSEEFELVYHGPNVMMGYATNPDDLSLGDDLHGVLHTGDLAKVDDEGFFYLVGRLKRIAKLFGRRINLADVENELEKRYPLRSAVIGKDDLLTVFVQELSQIDLSEVQLHISKFLNTTPKAIVIKPIDAIPVTVAGKKDYKVLST